MEIEKVKKLADRIHGWLTDSEGELLYNLAQKSEGKGVVVEIGPWKGKSTVYLAMGSKSGKKIKVYSIDPFISPEHKIWGEGSTLKTFLQNVKDAGVEDITVPIVKKSAQAAKNFDEPVELVFIDGDHKYESVKLDFDLWFPKLVDGGIMAFHDTFVYPGPKKVVNECIFKSKYFKNVKFVDSITYAQKVKENSLLEKLANRYILIQKIIYETALKLRLPKPVIIVGKKIARLLQ